MKGRGKQLVFGAPRPRRRRPDVRRRPAAYRELYGRVGRRQEPRHEVADRSRDRRRLQRRHVRATLDGRTAGAPLPPGAALHAGVDRADLRRARRRDRRDGRLLRPPPHLGVRLERGRAGGHDHRHLESARQPAASRARSPAPLVRSAARRAADHRRDRGGDRVRGGGRRARTDLLERHACAPGRSFQTSWAC